ncbi:putative oxidoreductase [Arthrobacter globiformis NBRC 12137]|uniref:Putative oxidoreductase n=1 Tax=Arthrobacter globiformis (strain ATCC 8010 / DSM 20124 / JCM 1332 / NBRC 12137 / NCIMB 8907 / NRRL B-2979 / 168) TaxID=1077972 RepID=H0QPQ1_ARTG1|nr:aldo/keto reductase [Arthrobacter globiformis]GAB14802.1 putative oxidoreductase [Arthrobacter globiformis NBRC 12137]
MKYTKLGKSGLEVSAIALGCMSYGEPGRGTHGWTLSEEESRPFIRQALELGINFFDTANAYSDGTSEEIVGRVLKEHARRDETVIATKVHHRMHEGPNGQGLSRKAILQEAENSLRRLGTDYIDLYIIHRFDESTPLEETLEALSDLVRQGKVLYLGASSMHAWQFSKCLHLQNMHGWARFVSMQNHYNLINREEEREMLPLCLDEGVGVTPWSPLARGRLARAWDTTSTRTGLDLVGQRLYNNFEDSDRQVVDAVGQIAEARGVPRSQVALAWLHASPAVDAPIVGATKAHHLEDAAGSVDLTLTEDEIAGLEKFYVPHLPTGF